MSQSLPNEPDVKTIESSSIDPIFVVKQQLDLIEFMLQQQKFNDALDKLMHLDRNLEQYALAPSLKQSLHQVIQKDQQAIQQFVQCSSCPARKTRCADASA